MVSTWTTEHDVEEQEISVERPGGVEPSELWLISGTLKITMVHDCNADCDADGNRGMPMTSEDERDWTLLTAARCGADGEWEQELLGADIPADVIAAAEMWAETYEPNDYGEMPERDYEDDDDR
jgi:hypothetical protein